VSCWNRQREWRLGRNSKGKTPLTFVPLQVRRVGIMVDGVPSYQLIADTQNEIEPLAKCIRFARESVVFHDEQPGITAWSAQTRSFECRDRADSSRVLLELKQDGVIRYVSAATESLCLGDVAAVVRIPTFECIHCGGLARSGRGGWWCGDHNRMAPPGDSLLVLQHFAGVGPPFCRPH